MLEAMQVAKYFLFLANSYDAGDTISNLKIQKMLYYAQGWHFALTGKELFCDEIEAWKHGPVVPSVYHAFKKYKKNSISFDEIKDLEPIDDDTKDFLTFIFDKLSIYSAWKLRDKTHEELPYKNNFVENENIIIPKDEIKTFFNLQLEKKGEKIRLELGL